MKKLYMILTVDIHPIGGNQLYTFGQAQFMESLGWSVVILFPAKSIGKCAVKGLEKYLSGGNEILGQKLPNQLSKEELEKIYDKVLKKQKLEIDNYEEILIASQNEKLSLWGEYFAKKMCAKHVCFITNDNYSHMKTMMNQYIDFYIFKYKRKELLAIDVKRLFEGYLDIDETKVDRPMYSEGRPIQDIFDFKIESINRVDYNIAYVGRAQKKYVPMIIREVSIFARKHNNKKILFVMVGEASSRLGLINKYLLSQPNVQVLLLGDLVPIPRDLYRKVDVVIAGAGCATYSANEGMPTIVVDADNCMSNGILEYTCSRSETVFHNPDNPQERIVDSLEDVLITKEYLNKKHVVLELKKPEDCYENNLKMFYRSSNDNCYYDVVGNDDIENSYDDTTTLFMNRYYLHKDKIVIFGAGNWGADCYNFLKGVNEEVDFYIDNDSKKWYEEYCGCIVFPAEILKNESDYLIIIACQNSQKEMRDQLKELGVLTKDNCISFEGFKSITD